MQDAFAYDRGLHVRGTPLWFDAERSRELCVLTALARRGPVAHRRAIASAPLAEALGRAGLGGAVLPAPWRRRLGLGGLRLELVEMGMTLGAAAVLLELDAEQVLVCGPLRQHSLQLPRVDHLVVELPGFAGPGAPLPALADRVAAVCNQRLERGEAGAVHVDGLEVGMALLAELRLRQIPVSPRGLLGRLAGVGPGRRGGAVPLVVGPAPGSTAGHAVSVDTGLGALSGTPGALSLRWYADAAALRAALLATGARRLTVVNAAPELQAQIAGQVGRKVVVRCLSRARQLALGPEPTELKPGAALCY